jgi:hypothetical protein
MNRYLAISAILVARLAAAGEAPQDDQVVVVEIPLGDADLRAITLAVLENNPLLASSPGVKVANATRGPGTIEYASVVFYPHMETAGIKEAFQAQCRRESPDVSWACEYVTLRRYVKLENQDFELRVKGDLTIEAVHALIEATRTTAQSNTPAGAAIPEAAIILLPVEDGYLVDWGSDQGFQAVSVMARLKKGGDPAVAEDWRTELLRPVE